MFSALSHRLRLVIYLSVYHGVISLCFECMIFLTIIFNFSRKHRNVRRTKKISLIDLNWTNYCFLLSYRLLFTGKLSQLFVPLIVSVWQLIDRFMYHLVFNVCILLIVKIITMFSTTNLKILYSINVQFFFGVISVNLDNTSFIFFVW